MRVTARLRGNWQRVARSCLRYASNCASGHGCGSNDERCQSADRVLRLQFAAFASRHMGAAMTIAAILTPP